MSSSPAPAPAPISKRDVTRNAILDATSQLVAEKGVDGFTMTDVAERGRVNRALIYHYFHDRDTLLFETIRYIVVRYNEIAAAPGGDPVERDLRMHIDHPEIGRFLFHLMLTGKPIPRLSSRITTAIEDLERLKAAMRPDSSIDPTFSIMTGWLVQLAWSCARDEIARLLDLPVEEADRRFIANVRSASTAVRGRLFADTASE